MKIAIIGAGMAGLTCADTLGKDGHDVTVFEKSRGAGGRMATRRMQSPAGEIAFDHGCQYFTAIGEAFREQVRSWSALGLVERWPVAGPDAWVGVPGMNAILRDAASRLQLVLECHARMLSRRDGSWQVLSDGRTDGPFDIAIVATPPEQAAPILSLHDFDMARVAASVASSPCWTLMLAFEEPLPAPAVLRGSEVIGWMARNTAKPGRGAQECWVVQATPVWSLQHLESDAEEVRQALMEALLGVCDVLPPIIASSVHRWRYAHAAGTDRVMLWNSELGLGACGDWLSGHRVECAWDSGLALGQAVSANLGTGRACATAWRA